MLVSGGADWTVRCWDVKSSGGPSQPRENGADENTVLRSGEEEGNETYVPNSFFGLDCPFDIIATVALIYLQHSPRNGLPSPKFTSLRAISV